MAVVDSEYQFIWISCEDAGSQSDAGIFTRSELWAKMKNDKLHIPPPSPIDDGVYIYIKYI